MPHRLVLAAMVVACGTSARNVERAREEAASENQTRIDAKLAEVVRAHALSGLTPMQQADAPVAMRLEPRGELVPGVGNRLSSASVVELEDGTLLYAVPSGCTGRSCTCVPVGEYRLARSRDGAAVVIHLAHRTTTRTIVRPGSCGHGCGVPQPPGEPTFWILPVRDRARIRVVEDVVDQVVVEETCEDPIAVP